MCFDEDSYTDIIIGIYEGPYVGHTTFLKEGMYIANIMGSLGGRLLAIIISLLCNRY
jgi:hypothetical protein